MDPEPANKKKGMKHLWLKDSSYRLRLPVNALRAAGPVEGSGLCGSGEDASRFGHPQLLVVSL